MAVRQKAYNGISGVLAHPLVWKHNCLSCVEANDCHRILRGPSVRTTPVLASLRKLYVSRSAAAIMAPSFAAVSTVRERRAFTSSTAVYTSCITQTLLRLLKRISVRLLSSTGAQGRRLRVAGGATAQGPALEGAPRFRPMSLSSYILR